MKCNQRPQNQVEVDFFNLKILFGRKGNLVEKVTFQHRIDRKSDYWLLSNKQITQKKGKKEANY
jgi:hypothetical protein